MGPPPPLLLPQLQPLQQPPLPQLPLLPLLLLPPPLQLPQPPLPRLHPSVSTRARPLNTLVAAGSTSTAWRMAPHSFLTAAQGCTTLCRTPACRRRSAESCAVKMTSASRLRLFT